MKTPIEMLIDKNIDNFKCSICGKKISENCGCWIDCSCGWKKEKNKKCGNPNCLTNLN